jgi:oligoribonuclease
MSLNSPNEPNYLCWLDCEFTNLDPQRDLLLQVGVVVTDYALTIHNEYQAYIEHDISEVEQAMSRDGWWESRPERRQEVLTQVAAGQPAQAVEATLLEITQPFFPDKITVAGNSPRRDFDFVERFLPKFGNKLHYRMLDVTSLKLLVKGLYGIEMSKASRHEARSDILESMDELAFLIRVLRQGDTIL